MGVQGLYSWVQTTFPAAVVSKSQHHAYDFSALYIDLNEVIHTSLEYGPMKFGDVVSSVANSIEQVFKKVQPQRLLFVAMDGEPPAGKGVHRRREEQQHSEIRNDSFVYRRDIRPKSDMMITLANRLKGILEERIAKQWNGKIVLSSSSSPGEGEHKILNYFRYTTQLAGADEHGLHCIYGRDSDIIMLSLANNFSRKICILRETKFISIHILKQKLWDYLRVEGADPERAIRDFVFLTFLMGNDYVPWVEGIKPCLLRDAYRLLGCYIIQKNGKLDPCTMVAFFRTLSGLVGSDHQEDSSADSSVADFTASLEWLWRYYFSGDGSASVSYCSQKAPTPYQLSLVDPNSIRVHEAVTQDTQDQVEYCTKFSCGWKTSTCSSGVSSSSSNSSNSNSSSSNEDMFSRAFVSNPTKSQARTGASYQPPKTKTCQQQYRTAGYKRPQAGTGASYRPVL